MNVKNRNALVIGMARSGVASAKLLAQEGARVTVNDRKTREAFGNALDELKELPIRYALGEDPMDLLVGTDLIVLSPGVPLKSPYIERAKTLGIEVIGEIELGYRFSKAPIVAITGTNGKTTTTALTGEIFAATGKKTYVLGNIGIPIVQDARQTMPDDVIVAEIAGFQLESTRDFHAHACAFLNITEDHLDRFGTMEAYIASKEMIFNNQTPQDFAVLNLDDAIVCKMGDKTRARVLYFSRLREVENGSFVKNGRIVFRLDGREQEVCGVEELQIPGAHNLENALAAVAVSMAVGVGASAAAQALRSFMGVEHRIEFVVELGGVRFINDSKGTNPDSTIKAVQAMKRPTVLIMGGSNKNSDYVPVFEAFNGRIKAVVALGVTASQILRDAKSTGYTAIHHCEGSFKEAVEMALGLSQSGDNVLLSPACASYDMFNNFEERGRAFKSIVHSLRR